MTVMKNLEAKQHDAKTHEAQRFYQAAIRAEQAGEPVRALLCRNIAHEIQHGTTKIQD
jgi:hypothetical protein